MLKKPFWVFSGTQWVFVNTTSYFKEPRGVLLNTILGFEELRGVFLKTIRYFIGPQLVLLNTILGTPRYCRTTRGFFLTDNTSRVFILLKPIKFSLDGMHVGYPLRYLKEPRELSVCLWFWISQCFEYTRVLNMLGFHRVLIMSEYFHTEQLFELT